MSTLTILKSAGSDFLAFTANVVASYDTVTSTATSYELLDSVSGNKITVQGTGFTYDGSGFLTGGNVTGFVLNDTGSYASVTGFSVGAATFGAILLTGTGQQLMDQFGGMTFLGEIGNDIWLGSNSNDVAAGGQGNDQLSGSGGNDTIEGNAGADILDGGDGTDTLYYGSSALAVNVDLSTNTVSGGDAQGDTISNFENVYGGAGNDVINGDGQGNYIEGQGGDDTLSGGAGDDTIVGGTGGDAMDGGDGSDTLNYRGSVLGVSVDILNNLASGGDAQGDTILNFENVYGSFDNDTLGGNGSDNYLDGGLGDDVLMGRGGDDFILGGEGADNMDGGIGIDALSYRGLTGGVTINIEANTASGGDADGDIIANFEDVYGGGGDDVITGNSLNNRLDGGAGNDTLSGAAGNDKIVGGGGADILDGGDGRDGLVYRASIGAVLVDLAANTASGGHAAGDTIANFEDVYGGQGGDTLTGDAQDNRLDGGLGDDLIRGGAGADILIGGAGIDTVSYADSLLGVTVNLTAATASGGDAGGDKISGFENITGSNSNDTLTGDAGANVIMALGGGDTIVGLGGNDMIDGGGGRDTVDYSASTVGLVANLSTGTVSNGDTLVSVESLIGTAQNDTFKGNNSGNYLQGGLGNDSLNGGGANDTLDGGGGNDRLNGGAGFDVMIGGLGADIYTVNHALDQTTELVGEGRDKVNASISWTLGDNVEWLTLRSKAAIDGTGNELANRISGNSAANVLSGEDGNDILLGGGGGDTLIGGAGRDTFTGGAGADSFHFGAAIAGNQERVKDFASGVDHLVFSSADYGLPVGTLTAANFEVATRAGLGQPEFYYNASTHKLYWDADGIKGGGIVVGLFTASATIVASDIEII